MDAGKLLIGAHNAIKLLYMGKKVEEKIGGECIETTITALKNFAVKKSRYMGANLEMLWSQGLYLAHLLDFCFFKIGGERMCS